jgi:hypothetical protein
MLDEQTGGRRAEGSTARQESDPRSSDPLWWIRLYLRVLAADNRRMRFDEPIQIACLACSASRIVFDTGIDETGQCDQCGYVGWTYAEDLDSTTREMIMNGLLARRMEPAVEQAPHEVPALLVLGQPGCDWPRSRVPQRAHLTPS